MFYRGRRLRKNHVIRGLMREHALSAQDLIYPLFLMEGLSGKQEVSSMPGVYQYGLDALEEVVKELK